MTSTYHNLDCLKLGLAKKKMQTTEEQNTGLFSKLSTRIKIAFIAFGIAKIHGILAMMTMWVNRPLAALFLGIAVFFILLSLALSSWEMLKRQNRT